MDGRFPPDAYGAFPGYPDARFEGRAAEYYHGDEGRSERGHRMKDYDSGDERNGHEEDGPKKKKKKKKKEKGERHHREDRGRDDSDSDEPQDSWRGREPWGGHGAPPFWEGSESWGRGGHMFGPRGPPGEFGGARGGPRGDFAPGMFPPGEEAFRRGFMGPPEMGPNGMPLAPSEGGGFGGPPGQGMAPFGGPGRGLGPGRGFGIPPMGGRGLGRGPPRPMFPAEFAGGPPFMGGPDMPPFWGRGGPPDGMEMGGPRMPMGRGFFPPGGGAFMDRGGGDEGGPMIGTGRGEGPGVRGPSRGEQNDYSQHFVDTGMRPQNFIRDVDLTDRFEEYPKLKELIQRKDRLIAERATPPMYLQMDLLETELSADVFGTRFDVILIDPPWEEYARRAPGVGDSLATWTWKQIENLKIEALADTPSFVFLWVGDGEGLDLGRHCLKKWGFRRCEDICWLKTNRENQAPPRYDESTIMQHTKEHCLMGIRGTVRRSTDGHLIHANVDTDIIISEEPAYGSTRKPEELYHIVEHFAQGRRRLELFGEDHNIRAGWVTVGKGLTSSNFNKEAYIKSFSDKDGKVWAGGRGIPVPENAPHLVGSTPEIENLRPKSPVRSQPPTTAQNSASQQGAPKMQGGRPGTATPPSGVTAAAGGA